MNLKPFLLLTVVTLMAILEGGELPSARPIRMGARYTTPKGIGYTTGYSTLEAFISGQIRDAWLPFLDLRGHVFDNGKLGANGGLGVRYLSSSRVWGINGYYDYRNTKYQHYNQAAIGLESLGTTWDFRLNGYLPFGKKTSALRDTSFDRFQNHFMYLKSTRDVAFKGANFEAGAHLNRFFLGAGPYYLNGKGETAWGGQLRGSVDLFKEYIRIEGNVSYDSFFRWSGQGQIGINIPIGKKMGSSCTERDRSLYSRAVQRVDRNEIIPVGELYPRSLAINPATGQPYYFVFVDNTSSSLGTFESPYPSLAEAAANSSSGQIIYVFTGDGTSRNMNSGITLKSSQMFLGSATAQPISTTLGSIEIPPLTGALPVITNTSAAPVITLSDNNLISGFYIENANGTGLSGTNITHLTASGNTIVGGAPAAGTGEAILLTNVSGQIEISHNLFFQTNRMGVASSAVHIALDSTQCSANFESDKFYIVPNASAIDCLLVDLTSTGSMSSVTIHNTTCRSNSLFGSDSGFEFNLSNSSSISSIALSNSKTSYLGKGLYLNLADSGSIGTVAVSQCEFIKGQDGINLSLVSTSSIDQIQVSDTFFDSNGNSSIYGNLTTSGNIRSIDVSRSIMQGNNGYAVYLGLSGSGSIVSINVANSTIRNSLSAAFEVYMSSTGTVNQLQFSNSEIDTSISGLYLYSAGSNVIDLLGVSNCVFKGLTTKGINITAPIITELDISNSSFTNCDIGIFVDVAAQIGQGTVSDNSFFLSGTNGILVNTTTANNVLSVTGNTFTDTLTSAQGYGAKFTNNGGTFCLNFTGNQAFPTSREGGINPYYFNNAAGTFNLTSQSTSANNIGGITSSGISGSCTQ